MRLRYLLLTLLLFGGLFVAFLFLRKPEVIEEGPYEIELGVSFSPLYAAGLGLNPREAYRVILDEFKLKTVRLPVYWSEVERNDDQFDFDEVDWYLQEAKKRGAGVVLTIGYRNFRYPECYPPEWAKNLGDREFEEELFEFLAAAVNHFSGGKFNRTIEAWQVENEPFDLPIFRRWCRHFSSGLVARELELVKASDPLHWPVILTSGGESFLRFLWRGATEKADVLGVSFYPRTVLPGGIVIQTYRLGPFSPRNIPNERQYATNLGKKFWVVEMQAEPWGGKEETMSPKILKENYELLLGFGGAERVYFWGAEWWYAQKLKGEDGMWEAAKAILNLNERDARPLISLIFL